MDGAVELTGTLWGTHGTEGLTITNHHTPVMGENDSGRNRLRKRLQTLARRRPSLGLERNQHPPLSRQNYSTPAFLITRLDSMKQNLVAEILELPVAERVRLVEAIWDSISAAPDALLLTQWQREELDRRLAEYEADPGSGATLEEVFARIRT